MRLIVLILFVSAAKAASTDSTVSPDVETASTESVTNEPSSPRPDENTSTSSVITGEPSPSTEPPTTTTQEPTTTTQEPTTTTQEPTTTTQEPTTTIPTTTPFPTLYLTDSTPYVVWNPKVELLEAIVTDVGYKVAVTIEHCNLNTGKGEYVAISTSENMDTPDTVWFVYTVAGKPSYLFNTNKVYVYFKGSELSEFTANFTRVGEELTTVATEEPTTTILLPTPAVNESDRITVYLGGMPAEQYKDESVQIWLKEVIVEMAKEYTEDQQFYLTENITTKNVVLHEIVRCPNTWPDYATCVSLTFGVAIELDPDLNTLWSGYQLNAQHLQIMFDRYSEKYLSDKMSAYEPPDSGKYLRWQIVLFSSVTGLLVVCLIIVRYCTVRVSERMRRRNSDTECIVSSEDRKSEVSLPPHYLQETPAIFDSAYAMYNPEVDSPYMSSTFEFPDYQEVRTEVKDLEDDTNSVHLESGA